MQPLYRTILAFAVVAALLAVGCSDDDDSGGENGEGGSTRTPEVGERVPFELGTQSFESGGEIPAQYTCDGPNISPQLTWPSFPEGTESLALVMDDPDAPGGSFTHWLMYDIPTTVAGVVEGRPRDAELPFGARQGLAGDGNTGYFGPCPPVGQQHRYVFTIYALDTTLALEPGVRRERLEAAMAGKIIGEATLTGVYGRPLD